MVKLLQKIKCFFGWHEKGIIFTYIVNKDSFCHLYECVYCKTKTWDYYGFFYMLETARNTLNKIKKKGVNEL